MNWHDRREVKKGDYAEDLVCRYFEARGAVPYRPQADRAHRVDILFLGKGQEIFAVDVKAKAARTMYPDTGININCYQVYEDLVAAKNISVYLTFVDEHYKAAYGNDLLVLNQPRIVTHNGRTLNYPLRQKGIIYFPLESMTRLFDLTEDDCAILREQSSRSYEYPGHDFGGGVAY